MGGTVDMWSTVGEGSRFGFTVSFDVVTAGRPLPPGMILKDLSVLLVDDNATSRDVLGKTLKGWGVRTSVAAGGTEALSLLRSLAAEEKSFSLAIVDQQTPEMEGLQLVHHIAADPDLAPLRLVMLTSALWTADPADAVIHAFLAKPVRPAALYDCLVTLCGLGEPLAPHQRVDASVTTGRADVPLHVLVVDDNVVNREVAGRMLESLGHRVDVATNGSDALDAVARTRYAAIFMDSQMHVMGGAQATEAIRALEGPGRHTPIISMTANAMVGDRARSLSAGMDDYLAKPVRLADLAAILTRWTGSGTAQDVSMETEPIADPSPTSAEVLDPVVVAELRDLDDFRNGMAAVVSTFTDATTRSPCGSSQSYPRPRQRGRGEDLPQPQGKQRELRRLDHDAAVRGAVERSHVLRRDRPERRPAAARGRGRSRSHSSLRGVPPHALKLRPRMSRRPIGNR